MLSAGAETLLRMIGWAFLPDLGARFLLQTYRRALLTIPPKFKRKPIPPPLPNTAKDVRQRRISFAVVIFLYLAYTTAQAYLQAPPNFYALLGVLPSVDEGTLKTAFRNYARVNHPDRVGASGEARFIAARDAFDTLKSETRRWAYDRFGPEVLGWTQECTTTGEYLERGLMASCGFWIVSAVALVLYAIFGQSGFGAFWRYNIFFTLISVELLLILSPSTPTSLLSALLPTRVPYQHIKFLHQLFISLSIAITRIGPTVLPSFSGMGNESDWEKERTALYGVVQQVAAVAARLDREISRMIYTELKAAHGPDELVESVSLNSPTKSTPSSSQAIPPSAPSNSADPSTATAAAGLGALELDDAVMRKLSKEVQDMVVEKNIKRHPMLARIWKEGVEAGRRAYLAEREKSREEGTFTRRSPRNSQVGSQTAFGSQTTAVELSQRLSNGRDGNGKKLNGIVNGDTEAWKKEYISRRARSEEHSPSPTPDLGFSSQPLDLRLTQPMDSRMADLRSSSPFQLRSTPPPTSLRNLPGATAALTRGGSSTSISSQTRPSQSRLSMDLSNKVDLSKEEKGKRRQTNSSSALERLTFSPSPEGNGRLSVGSFGDGSPAGDRFDSLSVRSRSMSLVG